MERRIVLFFTLLMFSLSAFAQSPWVNKKGSLYAQLSNTGISYNSVFTTTGEVVQTDVTTSDRTIGLFADYSISDRFSVLLDVPFKIVSIDDESLSGLGDPKIGFKYQFLDKIPFAVFTNYTAPASERTGALRTGYNEHAIDLGVSGGYSKTEFYTYGSVGYRYRTNLPDQILIDSELGFNISLFKKQAFFIVYIKGGLNTSRAEDVEADESVLYHNNSDYLSPGVKFSLNLFNNFWLTAGGAGAFVSRNSGAAPSGSIGIAYNLQK